MENLVEIIENFDDDKFTVTEPARIEATSFEIRGAISRLLGVWSREGNITQGNGYTTIYESDLFEHGYEKVNDKGKLGKRILKAIRDKGYRLDASQKSKIANVLQPYLNEGDYKISILDISEHEFGYFGDGHACFQEGGDYEHCFLYMEDNDYKVIHIWDMNDRPIARAWGQVIDDVFVIFNIYSRNHFNLSSIAPMIAAAVSDVSGEAYIHRAINLQSGYTDLYMNSHSCYAIAPSDKYMEDRSLAYFLQGSGSCGEYNDHSYTCEKCGDRVQEDDSCYVENVGALCPNCYSDNYTYCTGCDTETERENYVGSANCCKNCAGDKGWYKCDDCDDFEEEGHWIMPDEEKWVCDYCKSKDDDYKECENCCEVYEEDLECDLCEDCLRDSTDHEECDECGGWKHLDDLREINGDTVCMSCDPQLGDDPQESNECEICKRDNCTRLPCIKVLTNRYSCPNCKEGVGGRCSDCHSRLLFDKSQVGKGGYVDNLSGEWVSVASFWDIVTHTIDYSYNPVKPASLTPQSSSQMVMHLG